MHCLIGSFSIRNNIAAFLLTHIFAYLLISPAQVIKAHMGGTNFPENVTSVKQSQLVSFTYATECFFYFKNFLRFPQH